jgi:hypothetical protein
LLKAGAPALSNSIHHHIFKHRSPLLVGTCRNKKANRKSWLWELR